MIFGKCVAPVFAALLVTTTSGSGQTLPHGESTSLAAADKAAIESLQTFRQLVTAENAPSYGFDSPGSAAVATVGPPLKDSLIRLDSLKKWDGKEVGDLITPTGRIIYPIASHGNPGSSVTLGLREGKWVPVAFGNARESQSRTTIRNQILTNAPGGTAPQLMQVRVPALNLTFLAYTEDSELIFTPLQTVPSMELSAGKPEPAFNVLRRVQKTALKLNSDLPN